MITGSKPGKTETLDVVIWVSMMRNWIGSKKTGRGTQPSEALGSQEHFICPVTMELLE